jgi:hypothetical protein
LKSFLYFRSTAKWSEENRAAIEKTLLDHLSVPSNEDILGTINFEVGQITTADRCHAYLPLKDHPTWTMNCAINYAGTKFAQLPLMSNETHNQWRNGISSFYVYDSGCAILYIFA